MPGIYYALVSRSGTVLCDHYHVRGSKYEATCQSVLENVALEPSNNKFSYDSGECLYHAYVSSNLTFMCVTETVFDKNIAFNCLFELERRLISTGLRERAQIARPYALRSSFSSVIASVVSQYSSSDALGTLENKVDAVTNLMKTNIDKVIQRGETLNDLNDRSELLARSTTDFRQNAGKLKRKLLWKNVKLWIILVVILLVIIMVVVLLAVLGGLGVFKK